MRRVVLLLIVCSCGRVGFDAKRTTDGDGGVDAAPLGPFAPFHETTYQPGLTTTTREYGTTISDDGLEVYWSTYGMPSAGGSDIWRATRPDRQPHTLFGMATRIDNLASAVDEGESTLSRDGRTIYFDRMTVLYTATRPDASAAGWSTAVPLDPGGNLTGFSGADIGPGDLRMYVYGYSTRELYEVTRPDRSAPWGVPQLLPGLGGDPTDGFPSIRADGLEIFWESTRVPPQAIYHALRPSLDEPFGAPERLSLPGIDGFQAGDPDITADGRTLVFVSTAAQTGEYDVWTAERSPL